MERADRGIVEAIQHGTPEDRERAFAYGRAVLDQVNAHNARYRRRARRLHLVMLGVLAGLTAWHVWSGRWWLAIVTLVGLVANVLVRRHFERRIAAL